jgi:citrate lyase subunit beta / citryl-CoA lyase
MAQRSWLFVPGDSDKKLGKAAATGADVIIVDLEDSVALSNKAEARDMTRDWLIAHRPQITGSGPGRWVRINALDSGELWRADLAAVMSGAPDGIILPKSAGPESVQQLTAELYELEQHNQIPRGATRIIPLVSETAAAAMTIGAYLAAPLPRLAGLTWGAEDLSAAIGASRKRDANGHWTDSFRFVRTQTLLTAHAMEVAAIDTLYADFADTEGLKRAAEDARADGFSGMLAIHPAQCAVINAAFSPSEKELDEARAIVAAFAAEPEAGVLQIERRMIDRPHLKLAQRILGIKD